MLRCNINGKIKILILTGYSSKSATGPMFDMFRTSAFARSCCLTLSRTHWCSLLFEQRQQCQPNNHKPARYTTHSSTNKTYKYSHLLEKSNLTLCSDCATLAITLVGSFEAPLASKKSRTSKFVSAPTLPSKLWQSY